MAGRTAGEFAHSTVPSSLTLSEPSGVNTNDAIDLLPLSSTSTLICLPAVTCRDGFDLPPGLVKVIETS